MWKHNKNIIKPRHKANLSHNTKKSKTPGTNKAPSRTNSKQKKHVRGNTFDYVFLALSIQQQMTLVSSSAMKIVSKLLTLFPLPLDSR